MTVSIITYAKVGELLQGAFGINEPFLVSNTSSKILKTITIASTNPINQEVRFGDKTIKAMELFYSLNDEKIKKQSTPKIYFNQQRNFKTGKGLSSSSTDIFGILLALNEIYNTQHPNHFLYKLAALIEPTDPCLDLDSVLFNQKTGEIIDMLPPIRYSMLYFDSDSKIKIDTIELSQKRYYSENQILEFRTLYSDLKKSTENKDYTTFFECITKSAIINESILPKKNFPLLLDFATKNNCGLFVANSGTYMGLVIEPDRLPLIELKAKDFVAKHWETPLYIE
jgi:L-threonine kinase